MIILEVGLRKEDRNENYQQITKAMLDFGLLKEAQVAYPGYRYDSSC